MSSTIPHVAHIMAPAAFGGMERVLEGLLPALAARDLAVSCIAILVPEAPEPTFLTTLRSRGINVVVLRLSPRAYAAERHEVLSQIGRLGATIVHTHGYRCDVISGRAAHAAGYAVATTLHGFTRQGVRGRIYEWLQVSVARRFNAVIAVSAPLGNELLQRGVPPDRLRVIRNGTWTGSAAPFSLPESRSILELPMGAKVVGWIGRLSEEKDPELAIRVLAALRTPGAILAMIGDGPLMDTVRHLAAYLGVQDRVRLLGVHPDARRLLRAFDTVLLTSRTEGTPMVILEAAEAQVPVVATAVGGVPDLLGSDAATLAPHGDVDRLASAVSALLEDTAMAQREAEHLNERIRKGASEDWIDAYLQLYRSLGAAGTRLRR